MGAIKCLKCGKVLESLYRHDFRGCGCENKTFIDGGTDYTRLGGMDMEYIEIIESCEECGCRLDDKPKVIYAKGGEKAKEVCEKCYNTLKGADK